MNGTKSSNFRTIANHVTTIFGFACQAMERFANRGRVLRTRARIQAVRMELVSLIDLTYEIAKDGQTIARDGSTLKVGQVMSLLALARRISLAAQVACDLDEFIKNHGHFTEAETILSGCRFTASFFSVDDNALGADRMAAQFLQPRVCRLAEGTVRMLQRADTNLFHRFGYERHTNDVHSEAQGRNARRGLWSLWLGKE